MSHTVIVVLNAKPGKEAELEAALSAVVEPSRSEDACIEYRLHKTLDKPGQYVLYENWAGKEQHAAQFSKPYIVDLGNNIENLLDGPYQLIMAETI